MRAARSPTAYIATALARPRWPTGVPSRSPMAWCRIRMTSRSTVPAPTCWQAAYSGGKNNEAATSTCTEEQLVTTPLIDLAVTKVGSPNPVELGQNVTWTIVVTNNGTRYGDGRYHRRLDAGQQRTRVGVNYTGHMYGRRDFALRSRHDSRRRVGDDHTGNDPARSERRRTRFGPSATRASVTGGSSPRR